MLRIATIGTSVISENFLEALAGNPDAAFMGTLSRDEGRARSFTEVHGGTRPYTELDALAADADVDAVYIASPNALHAPQALALIGAGKHVLVEKPFASNEAEARSVFDAARERGVVALEAMRTLHDPAVARIRETLAGFGRLRRASLHFGKYSSRYDELMSGRRTNIFDCRMASGALMDIGIYCVEYLVALMGKPASIAAAPVLLDEGTRALTDGPLDGAGIALARYPDHVAEVSWSKITDDDLPVQFEFEQGTVTVDALSIPTRMRVSRRGRALRADAKTMRATEGGSTEDVDLPQVENTMAYELEDLISAVEAVRAGTEPEAAPAGIFGNVGAYRDITLASLAITDEIRAQAGITFPADRA